MIHFNIVTSILIKTNGQWGKRLWHIEMFYDIFTNGCELCKYIKIIDFHIINELFAQCVNDMKTRLLKNKLKNLN